MIIITIIALLAIVASSAGFIMFNGDAKRTLGTSTSTNALFYRKLRDEVTLTRLQIDSLRKADTRDRAKAQRDRMSRMKALESRFVQLLDRQ